MAFQTHNGGFHWVGVGSKALVVRPWEAWPPGLGAIVKLPAPTVVDIHLEGFELAADHATLYNKAGRAVAKGNVMVVNEKGETLETENLSWYQKQEQISTDQFVRITTPKEILLGDSMVANTKFSNYKIFQLRGTIQVED